MTWITSRRKSSGYWIIPLGLSLLLLFLGRSSPFAQGIIRPVKELRTFDIDEPGWRNPAGLAFSTQAGLFFMVQPPSTPQTTIFSLTPYEQVLGSVTLDLSLEQPLNMSFDPYGNRLLLLQTSSQTLVAVGANPDGSLDPSAPPLTSYPLSPLGLGEPLGLAVDPAKGHLYILDSAARQIVHLQPDGQGSLAGQAALAEGRVSRIELGQVGPGRLRGLAFHPGNGQLYVLNVDQQRLYELSLTGQVGASYDMVAVQLANPQGFLLAPSGDATDDPALINLFITNTGSSAQAEENFGQLIEVSLAPVSQLSISAVTDPATLVKTKTMSSFTPPSPDPSGLAYLSNSNQLLASDGEVDEMPIFTGASLFKMNLSGSLVSPVIASYSDEPTGVAYNPSNNQVFLSDDTGSVWVYQVNPGPNGRLFDSDDIITSLTLAMYGNLTVDSEGIAFDSQQGHLFIADGVGEEVWDINPGPNGVFNGLPPAGDDVLTHFDTTSLHIRDPEGIEFNPENGHLYIMSSHDGLIAETTRTGGLVRYISTASLNFVKPAGLAYGPASANPANRHLYIVDRGVDNISNPNENDGKLYEISFPLVANLPPVVNAGPDQTISVPSSASLDGTVSDDGQPNPPGAVTTTWSKVSGPGTVTFGNPNAVDTTASFSATGAYILRLTANDGQRSASDAVTITVLGLRGEITLNVRVSAGTDDAEESAAGTVLVSDSDLELIYDGNSQTVGLRFNGLTIPPGATILNAYVQFQADETSSTANAVTIQGQAADNAPTFTTATNNVSSRPRTAAAVAWSPAPWTAVGEAGPNQQTPDIAGVIQEIVNRPGWASGNSLAIIITGTGTGKRTAESFNGLAAGVPLLSVAYSTSSSRLAGIWLPVIYRK